MKRPIDYVVPMLLVIALVGGTLLLNGCKSRPVCKAQEGAVERTSARFAQLFQCKGVAAIRRDFNKVASELTFCPTETQRRAVETGLIGSLVCPAFGTKVEELALQGVDKFPKDWECSGEFVAGQLAGLGEESCKIVLP